LGGGGTAGQPESRPDGKMITLDMKDVPVIDQPGWPALDAVAAPARMTFAMIWKASDDPV